MDDNVRDLIFRVIDQTISERDFERLQGAIEHSSDVRDEYLKAVSLCESLGDIASEPTPAASVEHDDLTSEPASPVSPDTGIFGIFGSRWNSNWRTLALAATVLILVGGTAFWLGQRNLPTDAEQIVTDDQPADEQAERRIAGHATLRRAVDLKWSDGAVRRLEGDVLPNGPLAFEEGVVEIDFFCGATLIVEGPAQLDVESDWSIRVAKGRLRANVPPAARGFVVKAAGSEIIDLGTEFVLEVGAENARVEVIDGEVALRGGEYDGRHLLTGQSQSLKGTEIQANLSDGLSTVSDIQRRRQAAEEQRFSRWKTHSQEMQTDERLIAYYPIARFQPTALAAGNGDVQLPTREASVFGSRGRVVRNLSPAGSDLNGLLVGPVDRTTGRFGIRSVGLEFDRPGARVRTRIEGEFSELTFVCWVRIDSLEHRYNALFMADSYQTGEPHWQIRDDGRLMFSVMVDDTQEIRHFSNDENRIVTHAGLHRVYYTKPFWDLSKSGQWFHLAAVYNPAGRRVTQYVNGQQFASEEIIDKFHITRLRIGASEIGNWGQPFRKTPWFAVRNLNGTIDELAIFDAALKAEEIDDLYQQGKPLGY